MFYQPSYPKKTKKSTANTELFNSQNDSELIKILSKSPPPNGWDGILVRQCSKWLEQSERDGKEFKLNAKQRDHLHRIALKMGVIDHE